MTTSIEAVYGALKDELLTLPNVHGYDHFPGAPELPCFWLEPPTVTPEDIAQETAVLVFEAVFLVAAAEPRYQKFLWRFQELSGDSSVMALIQENRSLGFADVDAVALSWRPLGLEEVSFYEGYGAACQIRVTLG